MLADRQDRRVAVGDQPGPLGEGGEVGAVVEAVGPGQRQAGQDDEQADEERPRQRSGRPRRCRAGPAGAGASSVEPPPERQLPLAGSLPSTRSSAVEVGPRSIRCAPWLRTLFTSVLTGWKVISDGRRRHQELPEQLEVLLSRIEPRRPTRPAAA